MSKKAKGKVRKEKNESEELPEYVFFNNRIQVELVTCG